jgi:hypothetical protein
MYVYKIIQAYIHDSVTWCVCGRVVPMPHCFKCFSLARRSHLTKFSLTTGHGAGPWGHGWLHVFTGVHMWRSRVTFTCDVHVWRSRMIFGSCNSLEFLGARKAMHQLEAKLTVRCPGLSPRSSIATQLLCTQCVDIKTQFLDHLSSSFQISTAANKLLIKTIASTSFVWAKNHACYRSRGRATIGWTNLTNEWQQYI